VDYEGISVIYVLSKKESRPKPRLRFAVTITRDSQSRSAPCGT
jgi:hypothetical protein